MGHVESNPSVSDIILQLTLEKLIASSDLGFKSIKNNTNKVFKCVNQQLKQRGYQTLRPEESGRLEIIIKQNMLESKCHDRPKNTFAQYDIEQITKSLNVYYDCRDNTQNQLFVRRQR